MTMTMTMTMTMMMMMMMKRRMMRRRISFTQAREAKVDDPLLNPLAVTSILSTARVSKVAVLEAPWPMDTAACRVAWPCPQFIGQTNSNESRRA
eukprot:3005180-Amphidinium_carterae.1